MHLICLVDDRMGMTFGQKRLSRDKLLISDIMSLMSQRGASKILMESYSMELFEEALKDTDIEIQITENPIEDALSGDYFFDERFSPKAYGEKIEEIILYRWNRKYPATVYFDIDLAGGEWIKEESKDFCGNSHDNITREIWRRAR